MKCGTCGGEDREPSDDLSHVLCRIEETEKERDEADRRAGAAERRAEDFVETLSRRNDWLRKAKAEWGVDDRVSFDEVWKEALALKAKSKGGG